MAEIDPVTASVIRTCVPLAAGVAITQLADLGLHLDNATVTAIVTALFTAGYYVAARALEHYRSAKWGWLLGVPRAPVYPPPAPPPASPPSGGGGGGEQPGSPYPVLEGSTGR